MTSIFFNTYDERRQGGQDPPPPGGDRGRGTNRTESFGLWKVSQADRRGQETSQSAIVFISLHIVSAKREAVCSLFNPGLVECSRL